MQVDPDVIEILKAVAAPLDPADIKIRRDKEKDLRYIDARVVINRLNDVAFGQWSSYVQEVKQGADGKYYAIGTLTICGITHGDCGVSETDKYFDPPKAAVSDLLKRCAVRFGLGIELYSDDDQRPVGGGDDGNYSQPKPRNNPPKQGQQAAPANKQQPEQPKPAPAANPLIEYYNKRLDALKALAAAAGTSRPFAPAQLERQMVLKFVKKDSHDGLTKPQVRKVAGTINALFDQEDEPDKWRHSLIRIITGRDSVHNLTKGEASVLIDWAEADPELAATEAYLLIRADMEINGQTELPGMPAGK